MCKNVMSDPPSEIWRVITSEKLGTDMRSAFFGEKDLSLPLATASIIALKSC